MQQVKVIQYETIFSDEQQIQVNMLSQTQIDEYAKELAITTIAKSKNTTIDLTNIRCKSLPEIPETTKYLYLNSTKIQKIDKELPDLHILSMPCTPLTQIKTLPPTLLKLFINNTQINITGNESRAELWALTRKLIGE